MAKIKICGLTRKEDIAAVNQYMPDYIGFVFAGSRRKVTGETAKELKEKLNPAIRAAGVFVNEEISVIERICRENIIDIVQLHGDEGLEYVMELKKRIQKPVIKAFRIQNYSQLEEAGNFNSDMLLLDAYHPETYGGSGKSFDWNLLKGLKRPYFLAGGIDAGNIETAIKEYSPYCIDVSSGAETKGQKDPEKIAELISIVRRVE